MSLIQVSCVINNQVVKINVYFNLEQIYINYTLICDACTNQ